MKNKIMKITYIALFFILNIGVSYILTSSTHNDLLKTFNYDFFMMNNSFFNNFAIITGILSLVFLIARKEKTIYKIMMLLTVIFSVFIFLVNVYILYYGTIFTFQNLITFTNPAPSLGFDIAINTLRYLLSQRLIIAFIPVVIIIPMYYMIRFNNNKINLRRSGLVCMISSFMLILICNIRYDNYLKNSDYKDSNIPLYNVSALGFYGYYVNNAISFVLNSTNELPAPSEDQLTQADDYLNRMKQEERKDYYDTLSYSNQLYENVFEDKNLLLLQLESINDFVINLEVNGKLVMPFLSKLANEHIYYNNFYSNSGVGKTCDAEFASLTGIVNEGQVTTYYQFVNNNYETITKLFNNKGYTSYAINGSTLAFYQRNIVYPMLGFHPENTFGLLDDTKYSENDCHNGWIKDEVLFSKITEVLDNNKKENKKAFVFSMSTVSHQPYPKNSEITGINDWGNIKDGDLSRYLDYVYKLDQDLEKLFTDLEIKGILDDTIVMMYGDHTSGILREYAIQLGEYKPSFVDISKNALIEELQRVPFIIYDKNNLEGNIINKESLNTGLVRSQSDIKQTISSLFHLNEEYHFGVNILSSQKTYAYNPQNLDIFTDNFILSAANMEYIMKNNYLYNENEMKEILADFFIKKRNNDNLLRVLTYRGTK